MRRSGVLRACPSRVRIAIAAVAAACALAGGAPAADATPRPTPVFAYYYIWFTATSWNRAKTDFPLLGRYASDERSVMERQIAWARQAGIDGFIVSWKSTPVLNRRLQTLVDVATRQHFGLALIYQGLDFARQPLPAARVRADLELFARRWGSTPPFRSRGRPLAIWSGTWRFSPAQVAQVTAPLRSSLQVLASEKDPGRYASLAGSVDGDAYYWSSADPFRTPGYAAKLRRMSAAVHRSGGIWVAPAAPGFDARLIGGRKVVPRRGGATLRRSLDQATASSPDVVGLISWNEYSENSHVEPSRAHGFQELRVLADVLGAKAPNDADLDSSQSAPTGGQYGLPLLGGFVVVLLGGAALLSRRRRAAGRREAGLDDHADPRPRRRTPPVTDHDEHRRVAP